MVMLRSARCTEIFFINHANTRAEDIRALVELVQKTVKEKQGVDLELEIEFVGDW